MSIEDKIVWGGIYKVNHDRWKDSQIGNDQVYYQAVPCRRKDGSIWMQDTHQLRSCSMRKGQTQTEAAIERIINLQDPEKGDWAVRVSIGDWYHKGNEKLTEYNIDDYELICDLHDYRPLTNFEDYREYNPEDILDHIHLYNEHGYSWTYGDIGVMLVKKGSEPITYLKFKAAVSDVNKNCHLPASYKYSHYDKMIELHKKLVDSGHRIHPKMQNEYENMIWLVKRLDEMSKEISDYFDDHKYTPKFDYEETGLTLGQVHEDMERFLQEDCYCPGEIYGPDGFGYEIFETTYPCKVAYKNDSRCAVICRWKRTHMPEIIVFWYDDKDNEGRIIAAQRVDLTENNLAICKLVVEGEKHTNLKINELSEDVFPEDINNLINSLE